MRGKFPVNRSKYYAESSLYAMEESPERWSLKYRILVGTLRILYLRSEFYTAKSGSRLRGSGPIP